VINNIKIKMEIAFQKLACLVFDNAKTTCTLAFVLVSFFAYQILFIQVDTTSDALLSDDDPKLIQYNEFRETFGRPELIMVMIETQEIFTAQFINTLLNFHDELEKNVPHVKKVTSLKNIRDFEFRGGVFTAKGFLEDWENTSMRGLKSKAESSHLFRNFVMSEDGKATAVIIETKSKIGQDKHYFSAKENNEVVKTVRWIINKYDSPTFKLTLSGGPIIEEAFCRTVMKDLRLCVTLSLITIAFFMWLLFRRFSGVFLSMMITVFTLISTMGLLSLFGISIKITTIVVPAFIAAVSVAASVHILVIFFKHYQKTENKREAISFAMGHSGLAILMTSMTTAAGLLSFSLAELGAIEEVGYLSSSGVMLAFFYTIAMLPSMIALLPLRHLKEKSDYLHMDRILEKIAHFSCNHRKAIVFVSAALFVPSVFFISNLKFSHNLINFFPEDAVERKNIFAIDKTMKGSLTLELIVEPENRDLFDLENLNRVDQFSDDVYHLKMDGVSTGKVISIIDVIKEVNQAFNRDDSLFYSIPQNQDLIKSGVAHFESTHKRELEKFVNREQGKLRITAITTWADALVFNGFIEEIENKFRETFKDESKLIVTGLVSLLAQALHAAMVSMINSYTGAFVVITLMMILMLGDVKLGVISMIPNILPIALIMGIMGCLDIPLDLNSLLIGSIAIGLVVDDTVHFMYNFQKFYQNTGNVGQSVVTTLLGTGKAMLITSLVLSSGFFVLLAATLSHVHQFGIFAGLTILVALLGDFLLAPALMAIVYRKKDPT